MTTKFLTSRKMKNGKTLTVTFIGSTRSDHKQEFHLDVDDMKKIKKPTTVLGNYLPARFRADGLPCDVTFTVSVIKPANYPKQRASMRITELVCVCPDGLSDQALPVGQLLRMAILASQFSATVTPPTATDPFGDGFIIHGHTGTPKSTFVAYIGATTFTGSKEDYERIGFLWRTAKHGSKQTAICKEFALGIDWANKHIRIGKKLYPQFFKTSAGTKVSKPKTKPKPKTKGGRK
jgi:hypothetical protein